MISRIFKNVGSLLKQRPENDAVPNWAIGIFIGSSPADLRPSDTIQNPVLTTKNVTDAEAGFLADPFMLRENGIWYMFFEVYNWDSGFGNIAYATSSDGFHWTYERIVLTEPYSLSYPYVFSWRNDYYMVPECNQMKSVRLYRASHFPDQWEYYKTLKRWERFSDSSLIFFQDRWYMFTATRSRPQNNGRLRLYVSERLEGPYKEHPMSPVIQNDPHIARPAGRLIEHNGNIIRFAQDDYPEYGKQVWTFQIRTLTPDHYDEEPLSDMPIIGATGSGWNASGMHTIDAHRIGHNQWIACVDGYERVTRKMITSNTNCRSVNDSVTRHD